MASNKIPQDNYSALVELLTDAADGAAAHGPRRGVKANDGPTLKAALEAIVGTPAGPNNTPPATPGAKAAWNAAQTAKSAPAPPCARR